MLSTERTRELGIAGLEEQVFGETRPSLSRVDVVGELSSDYAINVHFPERNESFRAPPEWLEFVSHGVGAEITFEGVPGRFVRQSDGEWKRVGKPWWKFW